MKPDRVALRPDVVVDVVSSCIESLFGEQPVWWTEYQGVSCCENLPTDKRHLYRDEAIWHGRTRLALGKWKAPA